MVKIDEVEGDTLGFLESGWFACVRASAFT